MYTADIYTRQLLVKLAFVGKIIWQNNERVIVFKKYTKSSNDNFLNLSFAVINKNNSIEKKLVLIANKNVVWNFHTRLFLFLI